MISNTHVRQLWFAGSTPARLKAQVDLYASEGIASADESRAATVL